MKFRTIVATIAMGASIFAGMSSEVSAAAGNWSAIGAGTCSNGVYCLYTTANNSGMSASVGDSYYPDNPNFANGGPNMNDNTYYINNRQTTTVNFCQGANYAKTNIAMPALSANFATGYQQFTGVSSHRGNACTP